MGQTVKNNLCAHFEYSRPELWTIAKVQNLKTFAEIAEKASNCPTTTGCEVCKPAVASILAGLWNDHILNESLLPLQDTNDRYLANIQRGGLYSVIPRIAAGEVTPEKLEAIAKVAMEYDLYTKITGAQRIDISKWLLIFLCVGFITKMQNLISLIAQWEPRKRICQIFGRSS